MDEIKRDPKIDAEMAERARAVIREAKRIPGQDEIDALPHIDLIRSMTPGKIDGAVKRYYENERAKDNKRRSEHPGFFQYTNAKMNEVLDALEVEFPYQYEYTTIKEFSLYLRSAECKERAAVESRKWDKKYVELCDAGVDPDDAIEQMIADGYEE